MFTDTAEHLTRAELFEAKPENVLRLARYLKLDTEGMGEPQIRRLVYWLLTRRNHHNRYGG